MSQRSLLQWLGYPHREGLARDLLGWMIEHHGPQILAPILGIDPGPLVPGTLRAEASFERRRLDLYLHTTNALVGIEVKVLSSEGVGQLRSYAQHLHAASEALGLPAFLVFLTESGAIPEFPALVTASAARVALRTGVWDQIVSAMPDGDVLDWKREALTRAAEVSKMRISPIVITRFAAS